MMLIAAGICGVGCFAVVNLMALARGAAQREARIWLLIAALGFGISVWSTHFLAMLGCQTAMPVSYNALETIASFAIAVIGALAALSFWYLATDRWTGIVFGGVMLGLSIAGMHYTGVAAMRVSGEMSFNIAWIILSLAGGIAFAVAALARLDKRSGMARRGEVAFWLTAAIFVTHFLGMMALHVRPGGVAETGVAVMASAPLAIVVASFSLAILIVFLAVTLMERRLVDRAAQEEERRHRLMNNLAREALIIHRDGKILEVNLPACRMLGKTAEALEGEAVLTLFAAASTPALLRRLLQTAQEAWPEEMLVVTGTGAHVPVEITSQVIDFQGRPASVILLRDLSARKQSEERIRYLAHHDTLTDLPGRHLLHETLAATVAAAAQRGTGAAVLYLDLDRFKPVNDILGHAGGDAVLVEVARRLRNQIRNADAIARLGGDEFVVVVADVATAEQITGFANRLIKSLEQPFTFEGRQVSIGVSIGAALYPQDGKDAEALLRAADMAMYCAKAAGSGVLAFFEPSMDSALGDQRRLEQELRGALQRDEMLLHYQPLLNCRTGKVDGFEALLRWNHPERGVLAAGHFIPLAESTGLITRVDQWVIENACAAAASWPVPARLAVNVSASQFRHGDLPDFVAAALKHSGLAPGRLEIEVTEGVLIDDPDRAVGVLNKLRAQGVVLSLDDFGTGYSSLSYLRLFKFDKIKIDQSFITDLGDDMDAAAIVSAVIELGHKLGLKVTVEGIETNAQLTKILALGADQAQGYLLGRPGPAEGFFKGGETAVNPLIRQYAPETRQGAAGGGAGAPNIQGVSKLRQTAAREYL